MKKVYLRREYCLGCGLCEVYCAAFHSCHPHDIIKAYKLSSERPMARLFVERKGDDSLSLMCRHCEEPMCLYSCIAGAIYKNEDGLVLVNEEKCVGCGTCILACPYGLVKRGKSASTRYLALKCDLCGSSTKMPQCVAGCPNEALVWREEEKICVM